MKKAVTVVILVALLAVAGAAWWMYVQGKSPAAQIKSECTAMLSDNAKFVLALKSHSEESCASIADEVDREKCRAWTTRDAGKCPEAQKPTCAPVANLDPESCPEQDAFCRALAAEDPALCNDPALLPGEKQECEAWANHDEKYFGSTNECSDVAASRAAVITKDTSVCGKITDKNQRETCIRTVQGTA